MIIPCIKCSAAVCEGTIRENHKHRNIFYLKEKPLGQIYKNNSNDPNLWTAKCSKCQKVKNE